MKRVTGKPSGRRVSRRWSSGPWAVVRGPWGGEQAWRPRRKIRVPFQPIPMKSPSPQGRGRAKTPLLPEAAAESPSLARTTTQAPRLGARAAVSVAGVEVPGAAPCDRLRRFLRPGLGPGFAQMVCSPSVSVRLSRHTDRGNKVPASG